MTSQESSYLASEVSDDNANLLANENNKRKE